MNKKPISCKITAAMSIFRPTDELNMMVKWLGFNSHKKPKITGIVTAIMMAETRPAVVPARTSWAIIMFWRMADDRFSITGIRFPPIFC